ncbi:hypothetical protein [Timonella senegalensis]
MGRGYIFEVSVGDQIREVQVVSEGVGRWIRRKDVYQVMPTAFD